MPNKLEKAAMNSAFEDIRSEYDLYIVEPSPSMWYTYNDQWSSGRHVLIAGEYHVITTMKYGAQYVKLLKLEL
jgi:hypothetical protein